MENLIIKPFDCELYDQKFKTEKCLLKHKYTRHYKCKHYSEFFKTKEDRISFIH